MSRTHKTKPWKVKVCQGLVDAEATHDHSEGPCDLPELTPESIENWTATRCHWSGDYSSKMSLCGCYLCTGHHERIQNSKRNRKEARRKTRDWAKDPEAYDEEVIQQKREFW